MRFKQGKPVWEKDKQYDMNYFLRFKSIIGYQSSQVILRLTGSSLYQIYINGEFVAAGPARAAHGYYRVDEIDIQKHLREDTNIIVIEVGGYNINSFYLLDQPAFLQAELEVEGTIIAATGGEQFRAERMIEKLQKVQRYSFQRTFCEEYTLTQSTYQKKTNTLVEEVTLEIVEDKQLLSRGVDYESYEIRNISKLISKGQVIDGVKRQDYKIGRYTEISEQFKGYTRDELTHLLACEVQEMDFITCVGQELQEVEQVVLDSNSFALLDVGINSTGLIYTHVKVAERCKLYLVFDEILTDGEIDFLRMDCTNVVKYELEKGEYRLLTFEPYTFRYIKYISIGGKCELSNRHIKQIIAPGIDSSLDTDDQVLKDIYEAAIETYKQNAVDIYMDCPSRERAGWLCDSFFTSRVEYCLTGKSIIEKNFLENYLLPKKFNNLPKGMLPMCYPADHYDGAFIPNWAMWLVLELEEYVKRTEDRALIDAFKEKVYDLIKYFEPFENEDGLLEKLESWVFIEWSKSNDLVQDVSYPSNMLYAHMLDVASRLYEDDKLQIKSKHIKQEIIKQSYDGEFFVDNSIRKENGLIRSGERTESCQYYAFFCNVATPESHPELWGKLINDFGPTRKKYNAYPEIYFANAFIGNYLRLELLYRNGYYEKVIDEIKGYFYYMAQKTHTLWENDKEHASCNHGFASHVIYWIDNIKSSMPQLI